VDREIADLERLTGLDDVSLAVGDLQVSLVVR